MLFNRIRGSLLAVVVTLASTGVLVLAQGPLLLPTVHPPVAREAPNLWLAPHSSDRLAAASNSDCDRPELSAAMRADF